MRSTATSQRPHEIQANRAASAFRRGERDLWRVLSPAPAAPRPFVVSRGESLQPDVRRVLEDAFGADLDDVRIHRDDAAQRVAGEARAAAVTMGRDVYFGSGRFDDRSESGRSLITHEIAHVLQQTGRADAHGRLHATALDGIGEPMRKDLEAELTSRKLFLSVPTLDTVIARHLAENPDDTELAEHTTSVKDLIGDFRDKHPRAADLVDVTKVKGFTTSATVRSFYFDCLKGLGEDRAAIDVARSVPRETAFGLVEFYRNTLRGDAGWMKSAMEAFPLLRKYWPDQFADTFRVYLFSPARVEWNLDYSQPFAEVYDQSLEAGRASTRLIPNERFFFALAALKELDERRVTILETNRKSVDANPSVQSRIESRRQLAAGLARSGALEGLFRGLSVEAMQLVPDTIDAIRSIAITAEGFWTRVQAFARARADRKAFEDALPAEILAEIKTAKAFAGLEADLVRYAKALLALPGGRTPSVAAYKAVLQGSQRLVLQVMQKYDLALVAEERKMAKGQPTSDRFLLQLGWVQLVLAELQLDLATFTAPAAKAGETDIEKRARVDALVKHRLQHARMLFHLGEDLGFKELMSFAAIVLLGQQQGQLESQFAIDGEWKEDTDAKPSDVTKDFPPHSPLAEYYPLTIDDFEKFFYALYAEKLASEIGKILGQRGQDFSPGAGPVLNEALDRVAKLDRPRRWVLKEFYASIRPVDNDDFGPLVLAKHPRAQAFLKDKEAAGTEPLFGYPFHPYHERGIVIWTFPSLTRLLDLLVGIDGLDALVRAVMEGDTLAYDEKARKAKPGEKVPPRASELIRWFHALRTVLAAHPELVQLILDQVSGRFTSAVKTLKSQARRATTHQRRVILENKLIPLWTAYSPSVQDIRTYTNPNQALQWMTRFAGEVQPPEDKAIQMAALILELGPILWDRLGTKDVLIGELPGTGRIDIIAGLLPHLEGTLTLLKDTKQRNEVLAMNVRLPLKYDAHVNAVEKLKASTGATIIEVQRHVVFEGNKAGQSLSIGGRGYPLVAGVENAITIEGNTYALIEVYEGFSYSPGVVMAPGGVNWPESGTGLSVLDDEAGKTIERANRREHNLFKILKNGKEITVTGDNDVLLGELSYVLVMNNFVRQMEELGEVLEAAAKLGLDLAELVPGWGQAVMVVRFLTTALLFVGSPEFEDLKEAFSGDKGEAIQKVFSKLNETFTADVLWSYFLFGEPKILPSLPSLGEGGKREKVRKRYRGGAAARLGAILGRLGKLAFRLGGRFERMADTFRYPMRRTELFVHSRPLVALVLRVMVDNFARLKALQLSQLELGPDFSQKKIAEEVDDLSVRITELLEHIRELELPMEVVPLDEIVDVTVELVLDLLGGKYKKGVRVIQFGLEKIGAWQKIVGAITKELKAAHLDPNILWQETIRKELEPHLEQITAAFADTAGDIVNRVPFLKDVKPPTAPSVSLPLEEGEFAESEAFSDPDAEKRDKGGSVRWPVGGGQPLDPRIAARASGGFGHDFSHVRLHADAESDALTRGLGSLAITSGSHVYLKHGVSPHDESGGHILRHELAHVLQQGGPRPLGAAHSKTPVEGRPGVGLRFDQHRESAAEAAAHATRTPGHGRAIDVGRGALGPQPAVDPKLESIIKRFFKEVGADKPLRDFVHDIDRGAVGKAALDSHGKAVANVLSDKVLGAVKGLKTDKKAFNEPFRSQHEAIVDYVSGDLGRGPAFREVVTALVKRGMQPKTVKKKNNAGGTVEKTEWHFNRNRLELNLEEYLFARTGVAFDIELRPKKGAATGDQSIDLDDPFKSFRVIAVYLAFIGGTASLWDLAVENTWVKNTPLMVPPSRFKSLKKAEAIAQYKGKARLVLSAIGPDPRTFQRTEFRFSNDIAKKIEEEVFPFHGGQLPTDRLPPWEEYVKNVQPSTFDSTHGNISLRFGRYSENQKPQRQFGTERDAHHVPQYLLLEYFRNSKTGYKPFQHAISHYPGVKGGSGLVETILKPGSAEGIKVQEFEKGRAAKMPTILISKHAHLYGNVHVHAKPDDTPGAGSSPGFAVHDEFMGHLGPYRPILESKSPADLVTIKKQTQGKRVDAKDEVRVAGELVKDDALHSAIYDAVNKTYKWMRDDMMTKLENGLRTEEVNYYRQTAARSSNPAVYDPGTKEIKSAFDLKPAALKDVVPDFKKHSKDIAEGEAGFEGKK